LPILAVLFFAEPPVIKSGSFIRFRGADLVMDDDYDNGEREWVSKSGDNEDFKEYENKVERFLPGLNDALSELHYAGHLDDAAYLRLGKLPRDFQLGA
jgi:hypothetical protein